MEKILKNGDKLKITEGHVISVNGKVVGNDFVIALKSSLVKAGITITHRIGRYGLTTSEAAEIKAEFVTIPATLPNQEAYQAQKKKEREYDDHYNDGGEGYNPYRTGNIKRCDTLD